MKPRVASSDATRCCAWTKSTWRRCRLERVNDTKTCLQHRLYYDNWLLNRPTVPGWAYDSSEALEFQFQVDNGHVHVTTEYVAALRNPPRPGHDYYSDFYMYLIGRPHIDPFCNIPMLTEVVRRFCVPALLGSTRSADMMFSTLFKNPHFCAGKFMFLLCVCLDELLKPNRLVVATRDQVSLILDKFALRPEFESLAYNPSLYSMLEETLRERAIWHLLVPVLNSSKQVWLTKINTRLDFMKEEFIATAHHPDRFWDWCLDQEQKEDIGSSFRR